MVERFRGFEVFAVREILLKSGDSSEMESFPRLRWLDGTL